MAFSLLGIFAVLLEASRPYLPLILVIAALEIVLVALIYRRRNRGWSLGRAPALLAGMFVSVLVFILAPWITSASFSDLVGLLDWLSLLGGAIGAGLLAALLIWPLTTLLFGQGHHS
jgi:hypothetical protein